MLHKSFKPAKCKTALKLAVSRIKLLKNKKDVQVRQLKGELAKLLETGQDQTARIRVEHVVREEKTKEAYELIEIFCELIVARFPIIESQKNCPMDLKEAVSSVIFASPRCADIPELMDVRKHFAAKYGKEFTSAAVELRPECGVNRLLVEKLSAKAPDGQTKIKILSAVAEEYNIKWVPTSFGEKDPVLPTDLLNGPNTFDKASRIQMEHLHATFEEDDKGLQTVQVPSKPDEKHDNANFYKQNQQNASSTPHSQTSVYSGTGGNRGTTSGAYNPELRPSGADTERMELRHSYSGDENKFPLGRQNWNMEFKDATAAARAAAESAERASFAARAAAELSSGGKITHQYSSNLPRFPSHNLGDEGPRDYSASKSQGDRLPKDPNSVTNTSQRRSGVGDSQLYSDGNRFDRGDHMNTEKTNKSSSLHSTTTPVHDIPLPNSFYMSERHSLKESSESATNDFLDRSNPEKHNSKSDLEYGNEQPVGVVKENINYYEQPVGVERENINYYEKEVGIETENINYFGDLRNVKDYSGASASSHTDSSIFNNDHAILDQETVARDAHENPFAMNERNQGNNTIQTNSRDSVTAVFDDYGSDNDYDLGDNYQKQESSLNLLSPGRKSPLHLSAVTDAFPFSQDRDDSRDMFTSRLHFSEEHQSTPLFSESLRSSAVPSQSDDLFPVAFDHSDGECEEELVKSEDVCDEPYNQNTHSRTSELDQRNHGLAGPSSAKERDEGFHLSSSVASNRTKSLSGTDKEVSFDSMSKKNFGYEDLTEKPLSPKTTRSNLKSKGMSYDFLNNPVDEGSHQPSQQPSRISLVHEVTDSDYLPGSPDTKKDTQFSDEPTLESVNEFSFRKLRGGLRNQRGNRRPPYTSNLSGSDLSYKRTEEDTPSTIERSTPTPSSALRSSLSSESSDSDSQETDNQKVVKSRLGQKTSSREPVESRYDDFDRKLPGHNLRSGAHEKLGKEAGKKSTSRFAIKYFDSQNSDPEEDLPEQSISSKPRQTAGFSRRTKASSPLNSGSSSRTSVTPDNVTDRKLPKTFYAPEAQRKTQAEPQSGSSEQTQSANQMVSNPIRESKRHSRDERLKLSSKGQQSTSPLPKIETKGGNESPKSSSGETPSSEKAAHVHPKLPDYDSFAAHFLSLRQPR